MQAETANAWQSIRAQLVRNNLVRFSNFTLHFAGPSFYFESWSPAGENLVIEGDASSPDSAFADLLQSVESAADDFDPEDNVELWIPMRGTRGVPESIRVLLDDADAIADMYTKLRDELEERLTAAELI